ncbi:MAG: GNAT family N-acetyltransferase [Candidatus Bipolaricaulia bacterium]
MTEVRDLECRAMDAWPALESVESDGWVLRFSEGYTRRANSVHPLVEGHRDLLEKIEEAERLYQGRGLPPTFKMTEASRPVDLDVALAARGYAWEAGTSVQVADIGPSERSDVAVETTWPETAAWREAFHRMRDVPAERRALHDRMLSRIASPAGYATIRRDARVVACGLAVVQDGWLGIFDVIVDEGERRRGYGEHLMHGLLAWGRGVGAQRAYLQVMLTNEPAITLYDKLGFRETYRYWYRVKPWA